MRESDISDDEPVVRLNDALEFLRDESIRLNLDAVTGAIVRVLVIVRAQSQMGRAPNRLQ